MRIVGTPCGCRLFVLVLIILLGAGCTGRTYPIVKRTFLIKPRVTVSPTGSEVMIKTSTATGEHDLVGELIEVRRDGLLILPSETSRLTFAPYGHIERIDFRDNVGMKAKLGSTLNLHELAREPSLREGEEQLQVLTRFSRYPFGLDDPKLQALLASLSQSEIDVIDS